MPYVIAVYDAEARRTPKLLKVCRRYLHWVQNSVLEGDLTEGKLRQLEQEITEVMEEDYDSLILFVNSSPQWLEKRIIGKQRGTTDQFL